MTSKAKLSAQVRAEYLQAIREALIARGDEILEVASNSFAVPCLDAEGNETWAVITVKVPTGSRDDGEGYDGYGLASQYQEKVASAKAREEKKAKERATRARKKGGDK